MPTGGEIVVAALAAQQVERVFCVPGESYLPILAALDGSGIEVIVCRHEGAAAMAAEATGKLTGRPGVVLVTRGPGAANAMSGVHVAAQDSTPLVVLIGQVATGMRHRDAFQEVDYGQMLGGMCKHVEEVAQTQRLPEAISRAFHMAMSGRPGPVALALPEDVLSARVEAVEVAQAAHVARPAPAEEDMAAFMEMLAVSRRPLIIAGGSRWDEAARGRLMALAEALQVPVAVSFRRQMLFDALHPAYAGDVGLGINPALKERIGQSDLLILLGGRFSEVPSQGYSLLGIPQVHKALVHVHPGARELGRVYRPTLAINATPGAFLAALEQRRAGSGPERSAWVGAAHADYLAWSGEPPRTPGEVQMGEIIAWLREHAPKDAIITNGAGNYAIWVHRFWRFRAWGSQLAPVSGSMGYGLPAALAARLAHPRRMVICFAGDGCFQMTMADFATAVRYGAKIIVLVVDNGQYGTIRMHQLRRFPDRDCATSLANPDFAAYARACGGMGLRVETTEDFAPAFEAARKANVPALVHIKTAPRALGPGIEG